MPATAERVRFYHLDTIFDNYLAVSPVAHAVFRTAEIRPLSCLRIERPVLDIGCGAGQFAEASLQGPIDVGIDLSKGQLHRAERSHRYKKLQQADARQLPFHNGTFRTAISVSVLEHILNPRALVAEAFRVLQPGGSFISTVVLRDIHDHLFYPGLLGGLRLSRLRPLYIRLHDRIFRHHTLLTKEEWEQLLIEGGFELELSQKIIPRRVTRLWDMLLACAWPFRLLSFLKNPPIYHPAWFKRRVKSLFREALSESEEIEGSGLLFVAVKPPARICATHRESHTPAVRTLAPMQPREDVQQAALVGTA